MNIGQALFPPEWLPLSCHPVVTTKLLGSPPGLWEGPDAVTEALPTDPVHGEGCAVSAELAHSCPRRVVCRPAPAHGLWRMARTWRQRGTGLMSPACGINTPALPPEPAEAAATTGLYTRQNSKAQRCHLPDSPPHPAWPTTSFRRRLLCSLASRCRVPHAFNGLQAKHILCAGCSSRHLVLGDYLLQSKLNA